MTANNPNTMGEPVRKTKNLPKKMITHMPFIMFRPHLHHYNGNDYVMMDYTYFYHDLIVTSPYENGHYFDEMPPDNLLSFNAVAFDKSVEMMLISNTYYFKNDLCRNNLYFKMNATEGVIEQYNAANPDNPIGGDGFVDPDTGLPMFFTEQCDVIIPPVPPT